MAAPATYGGSQARGRIRAVAASLRHSHSSAGSLAHWARPGIELQSSWILVGFADPWATTGTPSAQIFKSIRNFSVKVMITTVWTAKGWMWRYKRACQNHKMWGRRVRKCSGFLGGEGLLRATLTAYGRSQARGWIRTAAAGLHHSHSNVGSKPVFDPRHSSQQHQTLTHWVRPGIKSASSWILVGFITAEPWWELSIFFFLSFFFFTATPVTYEWGSNWSCSCQPKAQPVQRQMQGTAATYATACSNAGSLTHWVRSGIILTDTVLDS